MKENIIIVGKKIELGESLKHAIHQVFEAFEKYNLNIVSRRAVVSKNKKKESKVELILEVKGKHSIVIESVEKDVFEALGDAASRVEKALRRLSDKTKEHKRNISLKNLEIEEPVLHVNVEKSIEEEIEDLIYIEMKLKKPMELEDAIKELRSNKNRQFFVFNDKDMIKRTIYKRADGRIGIY